MKKRSFTIAGHRTSVALEPEFWTALDEQARAQAISISGLVAQIDSARGSHNLASALRVHVLSHALEKTPREA